MQRTLRKIRLIFAFSLPGIIVSFTAFCQHSAQEEVEALRRTITIAHQNIDWKAYDTTSKVPIDSISYSVIQGDWKAYNGIFLFNGAVNTMALTTPMQVEFKDDEYRFGAKSDLRKFTLARNYFLSGAGNTHFYINKITDNQLVLTLDNGENYTRYYYEK